VAKFGAITHPPSETPFLTTDALIQAKSGWSGTIPQVPSGGNNVLKVKTEFLVTRAVFIDMGAVDEFPFGRVNIQFIV